MLFGMTLRLFFDKEQVDRVENNCTAGDRGWNEGLPAVNP